MELDKAESQGWGRMQKRAQEQLGIISSRCAMPGSRAFILQVRETHQRVLSRAGMGLDLNIY